MTVTIIIGKTFSGKTTLLNKLIQKGMNPITLTTTRQIRRGEIDGVDYNFENEISFHELTQQEECIIEKYDVYQDGTKSVWKYALFTKDLLSVENPVLIIDIDKLVELTDILLFNEIDFKIIYIVASDDTLLQRITLSNRNNEEVIETMRRLLDDTKKYVNIEEKLDKWALSQYTIKYIENNKEKDND